jgi:hypothetical protein
MGLAILNWRVVCEPWVQVRICWIRCRLCQPGPATAERRAALYCIPCAVRWWVDPARGQVPSAGAIKRADFFVHTHVRGSAPALPLLRGGAGAASRRLFGACCCARSAYAWLAPAFHVVG